MTTRSFSVGDIINESWEIIKKNIWIFAGVFLAFYIVMILVFSLTGVMGVFSSMGIGNHQDVFAAFFGVSFMIAMLLFFILASFFYVGYYRMALIAADGLNPTFDAFSVSLKKVLNMLLAMIIFVILFYIGFALCIIPGVIVGVRLYLFMFFIIDQDCSAIDALSKSWNATKGETLNLILLILAFVLINFIGTLCCGIGVLVTYPMTAIAYALVYRRLTGVIPKDVDFDSLSDPDNI